MGKSRRLTYFGKDKHLPGNIFATSANLLVSAGLSCRLNRRILRVREINLEIFADEFACLCFQRLPHPDLHSGDPTGINHDASFLGVRRDWKNILGSNFAHSPVSQNEEVQMACSSTI